MDIYQNQRKNKDSKAVVIGVFLIAVVFGITIFRSCVTQKDNSLENVSQSDKNSKTNLMSATDLAGGIKDGKAPEIIDVRDADSFRTEHIINSKNIPLADVVSGMSGFDKNKKYILVDQNEETGVKDIAGELIKNNEFNDVKYLSGGFSTWKNEYNQTISGGDPLSFTDQAKVKYINSDELKRVMDEKVDLYILDVRKNATFSEGHIKNAANIFLDDLETKYRDIPMGKEIVVYDNDGLWAFKAAVRLFDLGVFDVHALSDGLDRWKQKGYEIVK